MEYRLEVNGFENTVEFTGKEIEEVHLPLLRRLSGLSGTSRERVICLFAAPPGTGKSTTAALWEQISRQSPELVEVQALSIDGFHYPNQYLETRSILKNSKNIPLKAIKGAPETYDIEGLIAHVKALSAGESIAWPYYDRNLHNPVPDAIKVTAPVAVIEGNWVLHNEGMWKLLCAYADLTVYQDADESLLKERLIERKIRGGVSSREALAHYTRSDGPNIKRVRENRMAADLVIVRDPDLKNRTLSCEGRADRAGE